MINFRPLPDLNDTATFTPVPTTWPNGMNDKKAVLKYVVADWDPWWKDVAPVYEAKNVSYPLGIVSVAHALYIELTNGWSFDFCLRYCEEILIDAPGGVQASPNIAKLTTRARAGIDEQIASAVTIAVSAADGYRFLGDVQRYKKRYPHMVCRRWKGNGPDHLAVMFGSSVDGQVAVFRFLEAKGNANAFSKAKPRDFCLFKTQSLNADLLFVCDVQPILSYVYLPATSAPLYAQWFNASRERPGQKPVLNPTDKAGQAFLLLNAARDQYVRIMRKSRRTGNKAHVGQRLWIISWDRLSAVVIDKKARMAFVEIAKILRSIRVAADLEANVDALLGAVSALKVVTKSADNSKTSSANFGKTRFKVIARDATGFIFLRRA